MDAVLAYPIPEEKEYVINVFHSQPSSASLKIQYARYGHQFVRTGPILGLDLSGKGYNVSGRIQKAETLQQAEAANDFLAREGERIHPETLRDPHIHSFYVSVDGEAAGWLQLVTVYPETGYINQLYVLKPYRKRGLGMALVQRAHLEAQALGLKRMVLIPSEMGMPLYRRLGYRPLLYFSVFRPGRD
jgi:GNAT superfamily N-acetyltransferase